MTALRFALPRSTRGIPAGRRHFTYVRPSSLKRGAWDRGADWSSPTALSFEHETAEAKDVRSEVTLSTELEIPPQMLIQEIEDVYARARRALASENRVVNAGDAAGVRLRPSTSHGVVMGIRVKTWPAIPGITAPEQREPEYDPMDIYRVPVPDFIKGSKS